MVVGGRLAEVAFGELVPFQWLGLTDTANAKRLVLLTDGRFKYVTDSDRWFFWSDDEGRWIYDQQDLKITHCASRGLKPLILHELEDMIRQRDLADYADTDKLAKAYRGFAKQAENVPKISNAVKLARSERSLQLTTESLDSDPYLLGTPRGTIDLRTGTVIESKKQAFITKSTTASSKDAKPSQKWLQFLDETFKSDAKMIGFMKRLLGHALIGEQRDHVLPVFYGNGANGKSVFIDTVSTILGDYAAPMPDGLLTASRSERHPTEIADLLGVRLSFSEETSQRAKLDEQKVKRLTGGSELKARYMGEDFFTFTPSHTPFLITNHMPEIHGVDDGIWRRILVVKFDNTVPKESRDPDLKAKLLQEADGILGWMVEGCLEYQENGLNPPEQVQDATLHYRQQSDPLELFISECLVEEGTGFLPYDQIKHCYKEWAAQDGNYVSDFPKRLKKRFDSRHMSDGKARGYRGLTFSDEYAKSIGV